LCTLGWKILELLLQAFSKLSIQLYFAPKPLIPNALVSPPLFLHLSMLLYALVFSTIHPKEQKENVTQALHASLGLFTSIATWYETSFMLD